MKNIIIFHFMLSFHQERYDNIQEISYKCFKNLCTCTADLSMCALLSNAPKSCSLLSVDTCCPAAGLFSTGGRCPQLLSWRRVAAQLPGHGSAPPHLRTQRHRRGRGLDN